MAKERNSPYEPGVRSRHWLKAKHTQSQEFVIGGYTRGLGERASTFGALILGYNSDSGLTYCGAVGSGFDRAMLEGLAEELRSLETGEPPFANSEIIDELSPALGAPRRSPRPSGSTGGRATASSARLCSSASAGDRPRNRHPRKPRTPSRPAHKSSFPRKREPIPGRPGFPPPRE